MIQLHDGPVRIRNGRPEAADVLAGREKTLAYSILSAHDRSGGADGFHITFDSLISHDITYVGVIQTAMASGLERFPVPYVLTNCHNSLCAVGGTINADDHAFGLSAAKKFGASAAGEYLGPDPGARRGACVAHRRAPAGRRPARCGHRAVRRGL